MVHDPYYIEPRERMTAKQKHKMLIAWGGICCICGAPIILPGTIWDEHVNPLWLSGDNSAPNRGPAHGWCSLVKTSGEATVRAKIRKVSQKHFGAKEKPKGRPMFGTKASGWKHKLNGKWERY